MKIINRYMSIDNKSGKNEPAELFIEGDIEDSKVFEEDVSPKSIRDALKEIEPGKNIDIHINSYGGSIFAGNAIFDILDSYRRKNGIKIDVYYNGIGASMVTGIACVGDKIYANQNSMLMIHRPLCTTYGNIDDIQKSISMLEKAERTLISNYMRHFNGTEEQLKELLAAETWMTADEAKEWGLVDEILEPVKMVASAKGIKIGNKTFGSKVSDMIMNKYKNITFEKEETKLDYDSKLMNYGIDETMFDSCGISSDKLIEIADKISDAVKSKTEPVEQFVDKSKALKVLECEDITSEMLLNYAKEGMHQPDLTALQNKANDYDKIVSVAKQNALISAIKAQGDNYNEGRMKKFLDVLSYEEIVEQTKAWDEEAKKVLNAGKRVSSPDAVVGNVTEMPKPIKAEDYQV